MPAPSRARRAGAAESGPFGNPAPVARYALASFLDAAGDPDGAEAARADARRADPRLCFPSGLDDLGVLRAALDADPSDARANGYLGCWLLDVGRVHDALEALEAATAGGIDDPVVWRNAAIALGNLGQAAALPALERALDDPEPLVSEASRWAIGRLRSA